MAVEVIGFYRKIKNRNPFVTTLIDPIFYILAFKDGKVREFTMKLSGKYVCNVKGSMKDFDREAYRNYVLITKFLLGGNNNRIRENWGLSKKEYRDLIFQLYFVLVNNYSLCGWFKKSLFLLIGRLKYYIGGKKA